MRFKPSFGSGIASALVAFMLPVAHSQPAPSADVPVSGAATAIAAINSMEVLDNQRPLSPGDQINFRIVEDREAPITLQVTDSGDVEVPIVGRIPAEGKTCRQFAQMVKASLEKGYYRRATVIVGIDSLSRTSLGVVYLTGQVQSQGPVELPGREQLTVSLAILRAGGFSDFADKRRVRVIRKNANQETETFKVDVKAVLEKGQLEKDMVVKPGDVIIVPERMFNF